VHRGRGAAEGAERAGAPWAPVLRCHPATTMARWRRNAPGASRDEGGKGRATPRAEGGGLRGARQHRRPVGRVPAGPREVVPEARARGSARRGVSAARSPLGHRPEPAIMKPSRLEASGTLTDGLPRGHAPSRRRPWSAGPGAAGRPPSSGRGAGFGGWGMRRSDATSWRRSPHSFRLAWPAPTAVGSMRRAGAGTERRAAPTATGNRRSHRQQAQPPATGAATGNRRSHRQQAQPPAAAAVPASPNTASLAARASW
jgi:hypothetical protein